MALGSSRSVDRLGGGHVLPSARRGGTGIALTRVSDPADSRKVTSLLCQGRFEVEHAAYLVFELPQRRRSDRRRSKPLRTSGGRSGAAWIEDSGDNRLSRQSTIMGPAGLTAVFGMGTGVTPPVWSPENRPADCQATPAAIPRWSVTGTWSSRHTRSSGTSARTKTNPLSSGICHLPSGICHLSFRSNR